MRRTLRLTFALVFGVWGSLSPAFADDLTWEQCLGEASRNNADLQASRDSLRAADYQFKAAFSGFLPQVSGELGYSRTNSSSSGAVSGSGNLYSATLNGTENLFSGFQDRAKVDQAMAGQELAAANLDATRAKVSLDLKSVYAGLSYSQASVLLSEDIIRRRDANLSLVDMNFEGGRENRGSYLLSKANLSQARYEASQAKNSVEVSGQQMAKMLGRNEGAGLRASGEIPVREPGQTPEFDRLVVQVPAYRQAASQERINKAAIASARSQFYPGLDLNGSWGRQGTEFFPEDTRWNVGLSLSIPIFNGGRDYFGSQAALANFAAATANRESAARQVRTNLVQTWTAFQEAVEKLKVDEEFLNAVTTRAEIARNKYNNGLLSFENWDIIENDLISRQKSALASRRDRIIAEAAWEQAQGKGVIP